MIAMMIPLLNLKEIISAMERIDHTSQHGPCMHATSLLSSLFMDATSRWVTRGMTKIIFFWKGVHGQGSGQEGVARILEGGPES